MRNITQLPSPPLPRLVLLPSYRDGGGEPRVGLMPAGPRAAPIIYPSAGEAVAALRALSAPGAA